jgi:hypothetical protein
VILHLTPGHDIEHAVKPGELIPVINKLHMKRRKEQLSAVYSHCKPGHLGEKNGVTRIDTFVMPDQFVFGPIDIAADWVSAGHGDDCQDAIALQVNIKQTRKTKADQIGGTEHLEGYFFGIGHRCFVPVRQKGTTIRVLSFSKSGETDPLPSGARIYKCPQLQALYRSNCARC